MTAIRFINHQIFPGVPANSFGLGRNEPNVFLSERPFDSLLGCSDRFRFDYRLTHYHKASNRHGPFPDAALDTLNNRIFDVSIFHLDRTDRSASWFPTRTSRDHHSN
jgi:hypothetical protein